MHFLHSHPIGLNDYQLMMIQTAVGESGGGESIGIYLLGTPAPEDSSAAFTINTYDGFNRLTQTLNEKGTANYAYKPDGLRLSKEVNGEKTTHLWNGSNIVAELDGTGTVIDTYVRGINVISSANNGYYLFNAHGDVTQLANSTGTITKDYHYDAFGVETSPDEADANPFRYCGEYFDQETGSIYLRARYYNPSNGRFSAEDPILSGLNWYTYYNGNPTKYVDPTGLIMMGLRDLVKETYGSDAGLSWNATTKSAIYRSHCFGSMYGNAYINSNGVMMVDTAVFFKAMNFNPTVSNALSDLSSTYDVTRTESQKDDVRELDRIVRETGVNNRHINTPFPLKSKLSSLERVLYVYDAGSVLSFLASGAAARLKTEELYGDGYETDGKSDAFRHAYLNALVTSQVGKDKARIIANAHEYAYPSNFNEEYYLGTVMDLHNNAFGREIGASWGMEHFERLLSGVTFSGEMRIIVDGQLIPATGGTYFSAP